MTKLETQIKLHEPLKHERLTKAELISSLESEGIIFFPKHQLDIPEIDVQKLETFHKPLVRGIKYLTRFLIDGSLAGDHMGADHNERREFCGMLESKYGRRRVRDLIYKNNQLRLNKLSLISVDVNEILKYLLQIDEQELASKIAKILMAIRIKLNGGILANQKYRDYTLIEDINIKVKIVREIEKHIIEILILMRDFLKE